MSSFSFNLSCILFLLLFAIFYFSKKRINNKENAIYSKLLITNFVGLFIDIFGYVCITYFDANFVQTVISRLYLIYFLTWLLFFKDYIVAVSQISEENEKRVSNISLFVLIIYSIIAIISPISIVESNGVMYSQGIAVYLLYVIAPTIIVFMIILLLKNYKKLTKNQKIPLFAFLILGVVISAIQTIFPFVLLTTSAECFIVCLMYFTIENPDVKMIEQLDFAKKQADKANQAKTDFLSNMSHEIRTPLNAIVGFSQALSEEDCLNDQAQDEVKDIMMASENLLEIVNGILDISKIESGKLEIIAKDYSFKKVWDEVVALGRGRLGDKPLDFRTFYDESIPEVLYGDSTRIKEVIVNLLTNAIKYTKEGFVELKVSSVIKDDVCRLIISVEDSGIGIKQENIEKLFSKFERFGVEKEITIEGTGLGLAITKKLVDLMNGTIVVQSIYGKGSKFTVSIDQKIQVGHHIEDTTQSLNLDELITVDLSNKRVLVVDDNMVNLKVAARLLKDYNLIIDEVDNGMDCINKVMSDTKYDLILMDDMMPKMSGTETLHNLKDIDGFNIPTIALTANAISGMKEKYLGEGFNDYLAKPIDRKELNKIIKKFLVENKNE